MFRLNHRSIKVTLFSEIHIKIISKISLTYHQIAPLLHNISILYISGKGMYTNQTASNTPYIRIFRNNINILYMYPLD